MMPLQLKPLQDFDGENKYFCFGKSSADAHPRAVSEREVSERVNGRAEIFALPFDPPRRDELRGVRKVGGIVEDVVMEDDRHSA